MSDLPRPTTRIVSDSEPVTTRTIVSRVVLGLVAVALLAGMVVQFTPQLGGGGGNGVAQGKTIFSVNGQNIDEIEYERSARSGLGSLNLGGAIGQDIQNQTLSGFILNAGLEQDAARINVTANDVRDTINNIRQQQGWTTDQQYLAGIQQAGFATDAAVRDYLRKRLKVQKRAEEITKDLVPTDAELKFFYDLNKKNYQNEDRILARQIVSSDRKAADEALAKVKGGEDFAAVAHASSKEGADADGALNAKKGEKTPQPITKLTLSSKVADAAFALKNGGLTDVIEDGGKFYLLKVEKFLTAGPQSFEDAKEKLTTDVKAKKQQAAQEAWVRGVQAKAETGVVFPAGSKLSFFNPTVAKVGEQEIKLSELNSQVYSNQQIVQFLQQGGAQNATLITQFFKPQALDQLINQALALNAVKKLGLPLVGARADVLTQVQQYMSKDLKVSEDEIKKYYQDNVATYSNPATAMINEATFNTLVDAKTFRSSFLAAGKDFTKDAAKQKGTVNELGTVNATSADPAYAKAVFETKSLTKASTGQITDVIEKDKKFKVLFVTNFTDKQTKPYSEAHSDAESKALAAKQAKAGQDWIAKERKATTITNNLDKVNKELEALGKKADEAKKLEDARLKAAQPASTTPATTTPTAPK